MIDPALPFPIPHLRIQTTNHRAKSVERSSEFTFSNFISRVTLVYPAIEINILSYMLNHLFAI